MRSESAEDNRVRRADSGTGKHGDGKFRRHSHVDGNAIAFFYAQRFQNVGELLHFGMKLGVRQSTYFAGFALPDVSRFVFARSLNVAIKAVVREIKLSAHEPLCPGMVPLENFVPLPEPVQLFGNAAPKLFRLLNRLAIDALVICFALEMSPAAKIVGRLELALLLQNGVDVGRGRDWFI